MANVLSGLASQKHARLQRAVIPLYFWSCPSQTLTCPWPCWQGGKFTPSSHWETDCCHNTSVDNTGAKHALWVVLKNSSLLKACLEPSFSAWLVQKFSQKRSRFLWGPDANDLPYCSGRTFSLGQLKKPLLKSVFLLSFWRIGCPPPVNARMDLVYFFTLWNPFWKLSTKADSQNDCRQLFVDSTLCSEGLHWSLSHLVCDDAFEQGRVKWLVPVNLDTLWKSANPVWFVKGNLADRGAIFLNVSPSGRLPEV